MHLNSPIRLPSIFDILTKKVRLLILFSRPIRVKPIMVSGKMCYCMVRCKMCPFLADVATRGFHQPNFTITDYGGMARGGWIRIHHNGLTESSVIMQRTNYTS
uniref:Ovule protein n=1 Tax=Loa loa TaxID=7209 RepID=A0A1I7VP90_LOALO